ncbi:MAG TPA: hypothetical protein VKS21_13595, partial [Spirochaetota bacterium]|nr:hypothetical protein [Spirochaetota bacterium]
MTKIYPILILLLINNLFPAYIANLKVEKIEPGRTRLSWDYWKGPGDEWPEDIGYYDIYASESPTALSDPDIAREWAILLKSGQHWSKANYEHILANTPATTHSEDRTYYYLIVSYENTVGETIIYDDDVTGWIYQNPNSAWSTREIRGEGYASGTCLSNLCTGGASYMPAYVFFLSSAKAADINDYVDGTITFYIKKKSGSPENMDLTLDTGAGTMTAAKPFTNYLNDLSRYNDNEWTMVQVPCSDFTNAPFTEATALLFAVGSISNDTAFLIDKVGLNTKAVSLSSALTSRKTDEGIANRAVMREKVIIGLNKTVMPGYHWISSDSDDYIGWPETTGSIYSLPEQGSYDGNGAVVFGYDIKGWGGLGIMGECYLTNWDEVRMQVRGFVTSPSWSGGQSETLTRFTEEGSDFRKSNPEAFRFGIDANRVTIPVYDTDQWNEIRIPLNEKIHGGTLRAYWWSIEFPKGKGAFAIDSIRLVRTNIYKEKKFDSSPLNIIDYYPKSADLQQLLDKQKTGRIAPWIKFNKVINLKTIHVVFGPDTNELFNAFTVLKGPEGADPTAWDCYLSTNREVIPIQNNTFFMSNDTIAVNTFMSGRDYYFMVDTNTADYYGNSLGDHMDNYFTWKVSTSRVPLQDVELDRKSISRRNKEKINITFLS